MQLYSVYAGDDTDAAIAALTPLLDIGPVLDQQAQLVPYPAIVAPHGGIHMGGSPTAIRAGLLNHIYEPTAHAIEDFLATGESSWLQIRAVGGAVNDVPADATAYAHRTQNFSVNAVGRSTIERLNPVWDEHLYPHMRRAVPEFRHRSAAGAAARRLPGADADAVARAQSEVRPGQRLPAELRHRTRAV